MSVTQKNSCSRVDQNRRQTKVCYKYRTALVLVLSVVMFFTSVIPANAADLPATSIVNLMDGAVFELYKNTDSMGIDYFSPTTWQANAESLGYVWEFDNNTIYTNLFFTVFCETKPDWFTVFGENATFVGSNGYYYTYKYPKTPSHDVIEIMAYWDDPVSTAFHLVSAYGCVENAENISNVNLSYGTHVIEMDSFQIEDSDTLTNVSVPYSVTHNGNYPPGHRELFHGQVNVTVTPDQRDTELAESASCVVSACYNLQPGSCSAYLYKDDKVVGVLDTKISKYTPSTHIFTSTDYEYHMMHYQLTADLRDYDLTDCYIVFTFQIDPTLVDEVNGYYQFWYFELSSFWIQPVFEQVNTFPARVLRFLDNIYFRIDSGFRGVIDALKGDHGPTNALNQASQSMDSVSSSMSQANAQLNSVEKPSLNTGQLFGNMLNFDTGGLRILSAITSNQYVTSVMVVVFTFALCGYVFFGKKG